VVPHPESDLLFVHAYSLLFVVFFNVDKGLTILETFDLLCIGRLVAFFVVINPRR
jgi:hypothetical protein